MIGVEIMMLMAITNEGGVYCINYNIQNGGSSSNNGSGYKLVLESWSGQLLR